MTEIVSREVASRDGTRIAFQRSGEGPALILIDGALGNSAFGATQRLAALLEPRFTVMTYDRRGRGGSGDAGDHDVGDHRAGGRDTGAHGTGDHRAGRRDTGEHDAGGPVELEIDDLEALIEAAGGEAGLYGISSGAALGFEAALRLGDRVTALAMYEAPYNDDPRAKSSWRAYRQRLAELLAEDRRDAAVALFMRYVGSPEARMEGVRKSPLWPVFESVAPTLEYDAAVMGEDAAVPVELAARLRIPALVMNGDASPPFMRATARALAGAMRDARHLELPGQRHDVDPVVVAPALIGFFEAFPPKRARRAA
jgi:pimeloyl-ACP methyl ester carboxylesterase